MLIHIANLIILASFLVADVMWLRALSVLGGGVWISYFATSFEEVNWSGIGWNVLFTTINLRYIVLLILERRPVHLTERERELKHLVAPDLSPRSWAALLKLSEEVSGAALIEAEADLDRGLYLLFRGDARVAQGERQVELGFGDTVGATPYLTGEPPLERIESTGSATFLRWPHQPLRAHLKASPDTEAVFQGLLSRELSRHG